MTAVWAQESDAPVGIAKPLEWRLLTNRSVTTLDEAAELIDWYRARWEIEIFFHVLKNGCKVEQLQLSSIERLELALALFMIVAWRIQMLMRLGQTCPEMSCEAEFDEAEWQAAYIVARKPIPKEPPDLNTVIRLIASFRGFLRPKMRWRTWGKECLWIGLRRPWISRWLSTQSDPARLMYKDMHLRASGIFFKLCRICIETRWAIRTAADLHCPSRFRAEPRQIIAFSDCP